MCPDIFVSKNFIAIAFFMPVHLNRVGLSMWKSLKLENAAVKVAVESKHIFLLRPAWWSIFVRISARVAINFREFEVNMAVERYRFWFDQGNSICALVNHDVSEEEILLSSLNFIFQGLEFFSYSKEFLVSFLVRKKDSASELFLLSSPHQILSPFIDHLYTAALISDVSPYLSLAVAHSVGRVERGR